MPLLESLPEEVENSLQVLRLQNGNGKKTGASSSLPTPAQSPEDGHGSRAGERIAFATDVTTQGEFGTEWLVVDGEHLYVFEPNGGNRAHVRYSIPLDQVRDARTEMLVGGGQIEVLTPDETIPVVRYSQATAIEANVTARRLAALARGEAPPVESADIKRRHCPHCKRVLREDSDVCPACINKRTTLLRLFSFLAPIKKQVAFGLLLLLGSTALDLTPPYIAGRLTDTIIREVRLHQLDMAPIAILVGVLALARVTNVAFVYGQRKITPWIGARVSADIRMALYEKLNQLSLSFFDKRSTGSVMSRITNDAENLWDFLTDGLPWVVTNSLTLVGIGLILFWHNWRLSLLMLIPAPGIFLMARWFMPRARNRFRMVWRRISRMYSMLNSTVSGMRVVKAFAQEDMEVDRFRRRSDAVFQASYQANAFRATFWPLLGLMMSAGSYIIWIAGGHFVLIGSMTMGGLIMFNGYLNAFYQPFQNMSQVLDWSTRSMTAAERVFEVLDTEPDIQDEAHPVRMPHIEGAVEFQHVYFTYDKAKPALEDFTLKVEPGEMIGLVGHSGAGKSTIINLLARFYDVTDGKILVDGVDIRRICGDDFRSQLGIVLQEPFLFPGTIRDNIAYAKPDATVEEVMRAAKAANCHEFILKFPDGYDSQVGERGQRLSGGERQRISIARAILHNPRILILDEATASVDTETEKLIQEAISRLVQNRTTFAIAHRLSTLRNADRLVVMKEGRMVETGTHEELVEADGVYANLVRIQTEVNQLRAI